MNGVDYVREALAIIEGDVHGRIVHPKFPHEGALGAASLAARIGFSVQHFSRLFRSLTGETPADYILKRRLTEAARRMLLESTSAIQIALDGGWSDYETFSRAFKRHFGLSPTRARGNARLSLRFCEAIDPASVCQSSVFRDAASEASTRLSGPRLREEGPINLVGLPFFMDKSVRSFHRPWAIFQQALNAAPERISGRILPERCCQFSSWLENGQVEGLFILCGLEVQLHVAPNDIPAPFSHRQLPASTYLVFTHAGGVSGLAQSYERIYGEGLAAVEHKAAFPWELQRYPSSSEIEILIPVNRS